jgi:large subunit ribosomal protein L29
MKTMTELRSLSLEELKQRLNSEQEVLQKLRFAHAISPIENPMKIRDTKKVIARVRTLLKQKEMHANTIK